MDFAVGEGHDSRSWPFSGEHAPTSPDSTHHLLFCHRFPSVPGAAQNSPRLPDPVQVTREICCWRKPPASAFALVMPLVIPLIFPARFRLSPSMDPSSSDRRDLKLREERPHMLDVELEELELHPDAPDLQPGASHPHSDWIRMRCELFGSDEPDFRLTLEGNPGGAAQCLWRVFLV